MTKKRAVVLISGSGSNLQAFIDQIAAGMLALDISLVISNEPNAYGLERARAVGIHCACVEHTQYESRLAFDQVLMDEIDQHEPDVVILAGFMRILTPEFVHHYEHRLLNIHPSLLPKYPGNHTHQRVLNAGDRHHGVSVHFVVPEVDAGPVIVQGKIEVNKGDTADTLKQRIHQVEHIIYPLAVNWLVNDRLLIRNERVLLDGEASSLQLQSFNV